MNEELKVIISAEVDKLKKGVADAKKSISDFVKTGAKDLETFNDNFQKVGDAAKAGLKTAAKAAAGAATALLGTAKATEEYRTAQAKLNTAFESAGSNAEQAKQTYNDLYRVLGDGDVAVEAAGHLAKLTTGEKELAQWTDICQGVYATFGDSLPIESLTEAANETAKTGSLTGALADALNWAGINEDDFKAKLEATNSEAEREALIRETLSGIYDDAAATYEENAAAVLAQNEAQAKLTEATAKLGEVMAPVLTILTELATEVFTALAPHLQSFAEKYLPTIQEALSGLAEKIGEVMGWIADHWEAISTIGGIVLAIAAAISVVSTVLGVVNGIIGIYTGVMGAAAAVSLPMIGTLALIAAGIAVVIGVVALVINHWDGFTAAIGRFVSSVGEFLSGLWDGITGWLTDVVDAFSNWWADTSEGFLLWREGLAEGWNAFWDNVGEKIGEGVDNAKTKFAEMKSDISDKMNNVKTDTVQKWSDIKTEVGENITEMKQNISSKWNEMKNDITDNLRETSTNAKNKFNEIKNSASNAWNNLSADTSAKFESIKNAINSKMSNAKELATNAWNNLKGSVDNILSNIVSAVSNKFDSVRTTISNKMNAAKQVVSDAVAKFKSLFNFTWKLPDIKLPHFSISGSFSLNPPSVPKFKLSWYEKGGIFDKPTLFGYGNGLLGGLGENGAEAVVPLEKNTQWLDRIAERLGANSNVPIVLQVDGKTFAQTSISTINDLTKQTGTLGLVLI